VVPLSDVLTRIHKALDRIRPALELDGGDVALLGYDETEGRVRVQLTGACAGCHASTTTMSVGVERVLKQLVPEVRVVEAS